MRIHLVAAVVLMFATLIFGAESTDSKNSVDAHYSNVWIHFDKEWVNAPKDVGPPGLKNAPVTLLSFKEHGRLFVLQCWISTYDGAPYHISPGDPYRVFLGEWVDVNGRRQITYRLKSVEHTELPDDAEGVFRFESAINERKTFEFDGKAYRPSKRMVANLDEFEPKGH
jgi:hypothetical protein